MMSEKLSNGTFKHIEGELFYFHETKKELQRRRKEIITRNGPYKNEKLVTDPTGEKATSILADRRITHMERVIREINGVYQSLPKEKKQLVKLLYWSHPQELTWDGIAKRLHISKRQAQRWRKSIVETIAERLGWR